MPTSDPDCPFCDIVARDDPDAREVFRDKLSVAFFPLDPATLGHTLLIPRAHVKNIWEVEPSVFSHLGRITAVLARAIESAMNPDGLNIIQSNGGAASQTVDHLHVHVVPRWDNDPIGRIWPPETDYPESEKEAAWEDLKREMERVAHLEFS